MPVQRKKGRTVIETAYHTCSNVRRPCASAPLFKKRRRLSNVSSPSSLSGCFAVVKLDVTGADEYVRSDEDLSVVFDCNWESMPLLSKRDRG